MMINFLTLKLFCYTKGNYNLCSSFKFLFKFMQYVNIVEVYIKRWKRIMYKVITMQMQVNL